MQSLLQYYSTKGDVKRRYNKTVSNSASEAGHSSTPNNTRPLSVTLQRLVTRFDRNDLLSTRLSKAEDIEAATVEDGITLRKRTTREGRGLDVFEVSWTGEQDPANPKNWSFKKRIFATLSVSYITFACLLASSIDAAIVPQAAKEFGVSLVVESMVIGKSSAYIHSCAGKVVLTVEISNVFDRVRSRSPCHRTILRDIWTKSGVYRHLALPHDLHYGIRTFTKHRCSTILPLFGWHICCCPPYRGWGYHIRPLEQRREGIHLPSLGNPGLWRSYTRPRNWKLRIYSLFLEMDGMDQPHRGGSNVHPRISLPTRNTCGCTSLMASKASSRCYPR